MRDENGSPHVDHDGVQIAPANVVIQFVSYVGVPGVGQSQQAVTVGEGEAWILTDGKIVKGTWSRPDPKQPAVYTDAAGNPVKLTPGARGSSCPSRARPSRSPSAPTRTPCRIRDPACASSAPTRSERCSGRDASHM